MKLLLLTDVKGLGSMHDVVDVTEERALDSLLPTRKALVYTPLTAKRFQGLAKFPSSPK